MLFGSTGRTDLFGNDRFAELARDQYRSVHKLGRLPDWINVLPTHGFGSFCSVGASAEVESSTIHQEKSGNLAFGADDEDSFVAELLSGVTAFPDYYRHMRSRNLRGAPTPDLSPPVALNEGQLHRASRSSAWVVDLRPRVEFAAAHLHRSVNIEGGPQFTTYLGWLLPADTPLVLMGTTDEQIARAQLDLARIGVDHVAGRYVGPVVAGVGGPHVVAYPVRGFADLAEVDQRCDAVALDVRRADEWASGHLDGAIHVPLHELAEQIDQLPQGTIWVHCAAGFRASIAASLLAREGRRVVLVNDQFASLTRANGTQTTLNARVGIEDAA
jgi:rhodanese-related sulfurtransferase